MTDSDLSRRALLATAAGAGAAAATGPAAAVEEGGGDGDGGGGGEPDFGGYLDPVGNFDGVVDERGAEEVVVEVGVEQGGGPYGFGPAAVHVDNGATVRWEWLGAGGQHNVVHQDGAFESELLAEEGATFEHTFEEDGIYNYYCAPHQGLNMLGSVVVGTDYPTAGGGGGSAEPRELPSSAKTLGVATGFVMAATLGLAYFFIRYGGDYGEYE